MYQANSPKAGLFFLRKPAIALIVLAVCLGGLSALNKGKFHDVLLVSSGLFLVVGSVLLFRSFDITKRLLIYSFALLQIWATIAGVCSMGEYKLLICASQVIFTSAFTWLVLYLFKSEEFHF